MKPQIIRRQVACKQDYLGFSFGWQIRDLWLEAEMLNCWTYLVKIKFKDQTNDYQTALKRWAWENNEQILITKLERRIWRCLPVDTQHTWMLTHAQAHTHTLKEREKREGGRGDDCFRNIFSHHCIVYITHLSGNYLCLFVW